MAESGPSADFALGPTAPLLPNKTANTTFADDAEIEQAENPSWTNRIKDKLSLHLPSAFSRGWSRLDNGEYESQGSQAWRVFVKFIRFVGPGAIIAVPFIDPDNYQTSIEAGQNFQYKLLFMVLVSNIIAIYLQYLSLKMGTVTGMDLGQMNHRYLPRWLELTVYVIAETCIIFTDISQVVGTAFAWTLLVPKLDLVWGCVICVFDTLLILLFYSPTGELRRIRMFEMFIAGLVFAVFICICMALAEVHAPFGEVLVGFLPSSEIFVGEGLYTSCAILGGTLMPHALYIGSALARPRLLDYDIKFRITNREPVADSPELQYRILHDGSIASSEPYRPSLRAIRSCLSYSAWELVLTISIVAVFVNSALVIIAGAAFYKSEGFTDLYGLFDLFKTRISNTAALLFALSMLFSGISSGIVSTMAGQTVMEAALNIRLHPFWRRLLTRCVAIIPALIVATTIGPTGLAQALVMCNYILAVGLIFVTLPMVWYVTHEKYMLVPDDDGTGTVSMVEGFWGTVFAWITWTIVILMNIATIVLLALGLSDD